MKAAQHPLTEGPEVQFTIPQPDAGHWYAIHTRAQHEKKVTAQLQEKGVVTFLPLITQMRRWSDRRKQVQLPLFPCYAFVHIAHSVENRLLVVQTAGVLSFVGIHGVGIPIPNKEIQDIQALLTQDVNVRNHPFLKGGQRVRIRGGCLDGIEGIFVAQNGDSSLIISIELIQQAVAVRIDGYDVEPV